MLKQFITAGLLLLSLITLLAGTVFGQSVYRFDINVPFPFVLNGQTLPAGRYVIERTNPARPNIVTLKRDEGSVVRLILTQRVEMDDPSASSSLVFIQREGKRYLFQIWNVGAMNGGQVPSAVDKETRDQHRKDFALVTLRAKVP